MANYLNTENRECKHDAGVFKPVINRNRCEGKEDCVTACPFNVFLVGTLPSDQRKDLSIIGKIKGFAHGWQQAFVIHPDACHACGHCITACPENAITLVRA